MYIESLEIKKNKELKPCPFCGSNDVVLEWYIHHADQRRVRCLCANCMAMVDAGWWQNEQQPIQAWNRRVSAEQGESKTKLDNPGGCDTMEKKEVTPNVYRKRKSRETGKKGKTHGCAS